MRYTGFVGLLGLVVVALLAATLPATAQGTKVERAAGLQDETPVADTAIAVIDTRRVVAESAIGRGITGRAEAAAASWDERLEAARQELAALAERRSTQALTLTEAALAELDMEIDEKRLALRRLEEDAQRELTALNEELLVELNAALGPPLASYARERGFRFVFDSSRAAQSGLLYWTPDADATDDFIAQLNGAVVQWRDTHGGDGRLVGRVRVQDSDWLRETFSQKVTSPRRR